MPTVFKIGPYRFFFYAGDCNEPQHIHIESSDKIAKFWLDPIRLQYSYGFNRKEIGHIQKLIHKNKAKLMEAWDDYFGY